MLILITSIIATVEPLKKGHIGGRDLVLCWEVIPILEVD